MRFTGPSRRSVRWACRHRAAEAKHMSCCNLFWFGFLYRTFTRVSYVMKNCTKWSWQSRSCWGKSRNRHLLITRINELLCSASTDLLMRVKQVRQIPEWAQYIAIHWLCSSWVLVPAVWWLIATHCIAYIWRMTQCRAWGYWEGAIAQVRHPASQMIATCSDFRGLEHGVVCSADALYQQSALLPMASIEPLSSGK